MKKYLVYIIYDETNHITCDGNTEPKKDCKKFLVPLWYTDKFKLAGHMPYKVRVISPHGLDGLAYLNSTTTYCPYVAGIEPCYFTEDLMPDTQTLLNYLNRYMQYGEGVLFARIKPKNIRFEFVEV